MPDVVYRSQNLLVKVAHRGSACCVITFDSYTQTSDLDRPAFGEAFFAGHRISAVHVVNGQNRWYHDPDWQEAIEAASAAATGYGRIVTYGSSMGGYAAMRFADRVGASTAVVLSPQYSRDPRKVPFERRWSEHRHENWRPELSGPLPADVTAVIAYDPAMRSERLHLERIAGEMRVERLPLPHAGHASAAFLSECGLLTELVLSVVHGTADLAAIRRRARATRKGSMHYLMALSYAAVGTGRNEAALALAYRARDLAPQADLAWHYLGYLLSRMARHHEAIVAHRQAAELAPGVGAIQLGFATALRRVGDYDGALRILEGLSSNAMPREARRKVATMTWIARALRLAQRGGSALRLRAKPK